MELYIYESPHGRLADFRPYLDGHDHAFDDHRPLKPEDSRWEKIRELRDPVYQDVVGGELHFVGKSTVQWRPLMMFPLRWDGDFERVEWEAEAPASAG
jgi:hypothetical protein